MTGPKISKPVLQSECASHCASDFVVMSMQGNEIAKTCTGLDWLPFIVRVLFYYVEIAVGYCIMLSGF